MKISDKAKKVTMDLNKPSKCDTKCSCGGDVFTIPLNECSVFMGSPNVRCRKCKKEWHDSPSVSLRIDAKEEIDFANATISDDLSFLYAETTTLQSGKPTLRWNIGENVCFDMKVEKTRYNRFKWWIATRLFLPGTYAWLGEE